MAIETMGDTYELKAAVLAAKENASLPVIATVALGKDGRLLTGADVECVATLLEGLRVDAMGLNCGFGPDLMLPYVQRLVRMTSIPIAVKPNAGLPKSENGRTVFTVGPDDFAKDVLELVKAGAAFVGGCCRLGVRLRAFRFSVRRSRRQGGRSYLRRSRGTSTTSARTSAVPFLRTTASR
ncbi:MAG: homocysteine S-methyltransferase family protein [Kiritimatiellae bacterium]|nr:homocysteine S-methyltransferase family protein [Kiritimatiellia bacterium]